MSPSRSCMNELLHVHILCDSAQFLPPDQTGQSRQTRVLKQCGVADEVVEDGGELLLRETGQVLPDVVEAIGINDVSLLDQAKLLLAVGMGGHGSEKTGLSLGAGHGLAVARSGEREIGVSEFVGGLWRIVAGFRVTAEAAGELLRLRHHERLGGLAPPVLDVRGGVRGSFRGQVNGGDCSGNRQLEAVISGRALVGGDVRGRWNVLIKVGAIVGGDEAGVSLQAAILVVEVLVPAAFPLLPGCEVGVVPFEVPCLARHSASLVRLVRSQMSADRRHWLRFGYGCQDGLTAALFRSAGWRWCYLRPLTYPFGRTSEPHTSSVTERTAFRSLDGQRWFVQVRTRSRGYSSSVMAMTVDRTSLYRTWLPHIWQRRMLFMFRLSIWTSLRVGAPASQTR